MMAMRSSWPTRATTLKPNAPRLDALISWKPSGMIIVPCSDTLPVRLKGADVPAFVVADRVSDLTAADTVAIDNRAAGALAAEHLCRSLGIGMWSLSPRTLG